MSGMDVDTNATVEIAQAPGRMIALVAGAFLMAGLGAVLALYVPAGGRPDGLQQFFGYVGVVFFGLCACVGLHRLVGFSGGKPVVTLSPEGIRDVRTAAEFIPWSAIRSISTWQMSNQSVMVLAVDPAVEAGLSLSRIARWTRRANRGLGADGLCVAAQGIRISFDSLMATSLAYAQAWHR